MTEDLSPGMRLVLKEHGTDEESFDDLVMRISQGLSNKSQLAETFGVKGCTLNKWLNGRSLNPAFRSMTSLDYVDEVVLDRIAQRGLDGESGCETLERIYKEVGSRREVGEILGLNRKTVIKYLRRCREDSN